jgi:hypothetical protein
MMMRPPGLIPKTGNSIADLILGLLQPENPADAALDLAGPIGMAGNFAKKAGTGIASRLLGKAKKVYHGTPHTFPPEPGYPLGRFERGHIGEGEGGGFFGIGEGGYHGDLYETGDAYRKSLSRGSYPEPDVLQEYFKPGRIVKVGGGHDRVIEFLPGDNPYDWKGVRVKAVEHKNGKWVDIIGERERVHHTVPDWKDITKVTGKQPGNVYESALHAADEEFLIWDKSLGEQSQKVQQAIKNMDFVVEDTPIMKELTRVHGAEKASQYVDEVARRIEVFKARIAEGDDAIDGKGIYQALQSLQGRGKIDSSNMLEDLGIKGLKFFDQGSRRTPDVMAKHFPRTSNYVVFNPDDLEILRILGLTGAVLGTGAVVGSGTVLDDEMPDDI